MNESNDFICLKCNKNFLKRKKDFESHVQECIGNKCIYCNKELSSKQYLERHMKNCKLKKKKDNQSISNKINLLETELNLNKEKLLEKEQTIKKIESELRIKTNKLNEFISKYDESQQLVNKLQFDLSNAEKEFTNKDKEINDLKIIEKMNLQCIEHLKDTKPTIIYNNNTTNNNNNSTNQFANNINNATLIKSPEFIIESIDTKNLLQNNKFKNEEDFADYWHKKGLTKSIQVTDRSRFKTKHIDKNSNIIEDTNCSLLANQIYTSTAESAKDFTKDLLDRFKDIHQDEDYGKRDKNRKVQELYSSKNLALNIMNKNKKSLDRFGKLLVKYADYNIKKLIDQHKDKTKFITKLMSIINNKGCGIFWNDFNHIGEQLQYYLKNDIVNFETEKHILVKDDGGVNVKIDGDFLITFLIEMLREKNKEIFINDQLKNLLGNKYDNYANIYKMANFFFEEQTPESLTKAKQDIIYSLTT
jgi:hypothetical protein